MNLNEGCSDPQVCGLDIESGEFEEMCELFMIKSWKGGILEGAFRTDVCKGVSEEVPLQLFMKKSWKRNNI